MTSPALVVGWTHYRQAVVRLRTAHGVLAVRARPDAVTIGEFPDPRGWTVHIVTACNPGGRTVSAAANARAQAMLVAEVSGRGLTWWPAEGGDERRLHVEASVAIVGLDDDAARILGWRYGQDAIFAWEPGRWRLLSCLDDRAESHGWVADRLPCGDVEKGVARAVRRVA
ncbi:DUF3293 domain-containing protein [Thermopolyspora sp. NPDC052614]|uniref:DUF3293 domain-containing protein n=1 Tax=Thermopolyspora sp. NPDC052614 TaxID=3155682 RepID=UPI00341D8524